VTDPATDFDFQPHPVVPFQDRAVLERIRRIGPDELAKHENPDLDIRILPDSAMPFEHFGDRLGRLRAAAADGRRFVMLTGNPNPAYAHLARLINHLRIDCRNLWVFAVDEWADEQGRIAPESYPQSFIRALKMHFYANLDPDLRPPEKQFLGPNDKNINDYSQMLADFGGADVCYTGAGWTGHMAFIDPDVPEFDLPLEQWKQLGTQIVSLSPYTILQNALHACFGSSGDAAAVPPKAATIGPADILGAKARVDLSGITLGHSTTTWQRLTTRLMLHGPVTPRIPNAILQTVPTKFLISETVAAPIEPRFDGGY